MRYLVVSTGPDGRSRVVSTTPYGDEPGVTPLWDFDLAKLQFPAVAGDALDLGVPAGAGSLKMLRVQPGSQTQFHHTETVDLWLVVQGSCELLLDDGPVPLEVGDLVRGEGPSHGWRWGPDGGVLMALNLGAQAVSA